MDSNRIIINNIDQSVATQQQATTVKGFTVIKAPKGPIAPVLISDLVQLSKYFGVSSQEYPELFEVEQFIKGGYSVYVSAPYFNGATVEAPSKEKVSVQESPSTEESIHVASEFRPINSRIPVAYVTDDGILPGAYQVPYTINVENIANGMNSAFLTEQINGITTAPSSSISVVLKDINYALSTHIVKTPDKDHKVVDQNTIPVLGEVYDSSISTLSEATSSDCSALLIPTGLHGTYLDSAKMSLNFRLSNLPIRSAALQANYMDFGVQNSVELVYEENERNTQTIVGYLVEKVEVTQSGSSDGSKTTIYRKLTKPTLPAATEVYLAITGCASKEDVPNCLITTSNLSQIASQNNISKLKVYVREKVEDISYFHASIFPKYPSNRQVSLEFGSFQSEDGYTPATASGRNLLRFTATEVIDKQHNPTEAVIEGSLDDAYVSPTNIRMGFNDINTTYADQSIVCVVPFNKFDEENFEKAYTSIDSYPPIYFDRGYKETSSEEVYKVGWEYIKEHPSDYADVDIFFDPRRHSEETFSSSSDDFFTLANYFKQSGFIFNVTKAPCALDKLKLIPKLEISPQYWNICNEAIVELGSTGTRIISPLVGTRAALQARIIDKKAGGAAPMFLNDGQGLGGQLNIKAIPVYSYTKDQLTELDRKNYNPFILDSNYGIMLTGQKTCKPGATTDWSYIGHTSAFLNFQKEVKNTVMIPQLGKANNEYYRTLRRMDVERLLARRLNGNNRIWAQAIVDTSTAEGVNDAAARRARKFVIDVKVKVDVFSEFVELNFTNVDQSVQL